MIKKEIRRATQRKDWQTVKELQDILKTVDERRKLQKEAEVNLIKASSHQTNS